MKRVRFETEVWIIEINEVTDKAYFASISFTHRKTGKQKDYDIMCGDIEAVEFTDRSLTITTEAENYYYFIVQETGELVGDIYDTRDNEHIDSIACWDFEND